MGLISRASVSLTRQVPLGSEKKKTGLLDRVKNASLYDSLRSGLTECLKAYGIDFGGLLCSSPSGDWFLLCPVGFDLTTVRRFIVSESTMHDVLSLNETRQTLSGKDIKPFLGFFSSKEADALKAIHLIRLTTFEPKICLLMVESDLSSKRSAVTHPLKDTEQAEELRTIANDSRKVVSLLLPGARPDHGSMREKAKSLLTAGMKAELLTLSLEKALGNQDSIATNPEISEIFQAILSRIKKKAGNSNLVCVREDFTLRVVLFSSNSIDPEMYVRQLFSPLERVFGIPRIAAIAIEYRGQSDSLQEILSFANGRA